MKSFIKGLVLVVALLAFPVLAHAQAPAVQPPIDTVRLVISGGVSPVTNDLPLTSVSGPVACSSVPAGGVHNPTAFEYKVLSSDSQCFRYNDPGNGPLISLPVGGTTYTATLAYKNSNGVGPVSNVSNPFDRPGVLPTTAPATLGVR